MNGVSLKAMRLLTARGTKGKIGTVVSDTFTRANTTTNLGVADTGLAWESLIGTWGISSNAAYTPTGVNYASAVIESKISNCIISVVTTAVAATNQGLIFRASDGNNYFRLIQDGSTTYLQRNIGGSFTTLATAATGSAVGTILKVELLGSSIKAFINGLLVASAVDSFNLDATKHGLHIYNSTAGRLDNFIIEVI